MSARRGWLHATFAGLLALGGGATAHDLITAESAQRYLERAQVELNVIRSQAGPARQAQANLALGRMLDEIGELLNRDIASHGEVQGLASNHLVAELRRIGAPLASANGRFVAHLAYYRRALELAPVGAPAADARFRLLRGYFYDSFADDPLQPRNQTWAMLQAQISLGEELLQQHPQYPEREEAEFILAVHYMQAAHTAPEPGARSAHAARAAAAAAAFRGRYPQSMRVVAIDVLAESLPSRAR